jgi:hypothetical protein
MHLMYTLDDKGNRVYTLKVRFSLPEISPHPSSSYRLPDSDRFFYAPTETTCKRCHYQIGSSRCASSFVPIFMPPRF